MKAVKDGSYRKKGTGNLVFRYKVVGTPAEIESYKNAQGENYRETEDKEPLYFSTRNIGDVCPLGISQSGNVFADTSEMDAAANLASQYGGNLGTEIAKIAAAKFLGGNRGTVASTPVAEESKTDLSQS